MPKVGDCRAPPLHHPRPVAVGYGGLEPGERARPLRLGRRVAQIDQDLAVTLRDRVATHRIAADERSAAGEIELPTQRGPSVPSLCG